MEISSKQRLYLFGRTCGNLKVTGSFFAVIGDVHFAIGLAERSLNQLEEELHLKISQVFSVGDMGLFLQESDWHQPGQDPTGRQNLATNCCIAQVR